MSAGRNDPCPCGSGKKYKKCCLPNEAPPPNEFFWQRLHSMRNGLIGKVLKHAADVYGPNAIEEAWSEFHLWANEEPFDPDAKDVQVFMPWFFYDWYPDESETEVNSDAPMDLVPAMSLVKFRKGRLDDLERSYLEECSAKGFSFYEILESWPGKGFKAKDVLTGEFHNIVEKSGSKTLKSGDMIFGKAVTVNELTTLEACSIFIIPPRFKMRIMDLRKVLAKGDGPVTHEDLREFTLEVVEVYQQIREVLENPRMPTLHNTDGDRIAPHKLTYEIESLEATLKALAPLSLNMSRDEIIDDAEKNADGSIKSVEFPWLKKGNEKYKEWDNTVLGHIRIEEKKLIVEVNSVKRADFFEAELKSQMPTGWKLKSKVVEPIEQHLKNARSGQQSLSRSKEHEDLNSRPEVQEAISKMMQKHWDNWVRDKIPALGNRTPLEAVKTADGREALDALITQFERDAENRSMPGQTVETFKALRERLGM